MLQEVEPEKGWSSEKHAKWYKKMLDIAFNNLFK
jgi:hypothetical protein